MKHGTKRENTFMSAFIGVTLVFLTESCEGDEVAWNTYLKWGTDDFVNEEAIFDLFAFFVYGVMKPPSLP
jgi:hypothetical protein